MCSAGTRPYRSDSVSIWAASIGSRMATCLDSCPDLSSRKPNDFPTVLGNEVTFMDKFKNVINFILIIFVNQETPIVQLIRHNRRKTLSKKWLWVHIFFLIFFKYFLLINFFLQFKSFFYWWLYFCRDQCIPLFVREQWEYTENFSNKLLFQIFYYWVYFVNRSKWVYHRHHLSYQWQIIDYITARECMIKF